MERKTDYKNDDKKMIYEILGNRQDVKKEYVSEKNKLKHIEDELDNLLERNVIRKLFNLFFAIVSGSLLIIIAVNPIANCLECGISFAIMTIFNFIIKGIYGTRKGNEDKYLFLVMKKSLVQSYLADLDNVLNDAKGMNDFALVKTGDMDEEIDFAYKFNGYYNNKIDNNLENETDKIKRLIRDRNDKL